MADPGAFSGSPEPHAQHIPSLSLRKDIFLDWHSKFAFSRPIRLGSKEVLPTIQLPALTGRSKDIPTAAVSQDRQRLGDSYKEPEGSTTLSLPSFLEVDDEQLQPPGPIMETPHPEMYQPHAGLIDLGRSLYAPAPEPQRSESILNMPRLPERRAAPISSPSITTPKPLAAPSAAPKAESDIQLLDADAEGESLVIYGNPNLQQAILSGEMDAHALIDQARHEEENGLHILAPLVTKAVLEGSYDVVVQLIQRNMECIDVAIQVAEDNGKFALVKYLGMWKEHHRKYGNQMAGSYTPSPGPSSSNLPRMPRRPKKIDDDDDDSYSPKPGKIGGGKLTPYDQRDLRARGPSSGSRSRTRDEDLAVDEDDSEETWKLRAIYLLMLMIFLSETTSTEGTGWDSVSTTSSSRQSSQAPVDGGDHHTHSGTASRLTLPPGGGRRMGSDGHKKKRRDDDDSEESEGSRRPNNRRRRPSNLKSLGKRYACPFAKANPDNHVTCWTINRQNLAGVKEHLKRFHFGGTLPSDIRAARTWDDVFDCIAPDWGNNPRPSPYVDMLDIFQRSVRPGPANSTASSAMEGVQQHYNEPFSHPEYPPHLPIGRQYPQHLQQSPIGVTSPGLSPDPLQAAPVTGLNPAGGLSPEAIYRSIYGGPPSNTNLFSGPSLQSQPQLVGGIGATSPAPTSVGTFDGINIPQNPYTQPMDTASLSALGLPPTTQPFNLNTISAMGLGMPGLLNALGPPHFQNLSPQELAEGFRNASDFFATEFDIETGSGRPAGDAFIEILDVMESPAPVTQLEPVLESSPEPASAMTTDTMHAFYTYQQPPQANRPTPTSSIVSNSTASRSASLPSSYPSTTTSMAVHQPQTIPPTAGTPLIYHTPPTNPSTTPVHISHISSPPSTTSIKEKRYQLLISRKPAIPGSTEHPGHRVFAFDGFEEFARNFDAFMYQEFTDPAFNWEGWELMNGVTGARLEGTNAVSKDLDFTFLVHMNNRAALYLVAREGF
ncbi:uncharacterized protein DFL_002051 [Arthrobotrys flagrans]|uniref:Uncharacterized protein n=1 Tax=Arthrobotrys flagrans TaxID=97331 RepID=A0A437A9E5_ARTFL|nr:hypothetical protein DFL_002051 [Arthrobotrys flagrans]